MSKKNYSKQKRDKAAVAVMVVAVLVAVILVAYVALSLVYHSWNPVPWIESKQTQVGNGDANTDEDKKPEMPGDGTTDDKPNDGEPGEALMTESGFVITPEEHGISLMSAKIAAEDYADYGIDTQAETAYTITATVTPADATITTVSWGIAWKNPSSEWASGKNVSNYVTTAFETNSATVSCKAAFGEQIILTATADGTPSVNSSCTFDYVKRLESVSISKMYPQYTADLDGDEVQIVRSYALGTGTISGSLSWNDRASIILNKDLTDSKYWTAFVNEVRQSSNYTFDDWNSVNIQSVEEDEYGETEFVYVYYEDWIFDDSGNVLQWNKYSTRANNLLRAAFYDVFGSGSDYCFNCTYKYTYGGTTYANGTAVSDYYSFDVDNLYVEVTSVNLSGGNFIF